MQTAFTYKLLLERQDRARFGFKPHSECCTLIVVYRLRMEHLVFDPKTLNCFLYSCILLSRGRCGSRAASGPSDSLCSQMTEVLH